MAVAASDGFQRIEQRECGAKRIGAQALAGDQRPAGLAASVYAASEGLNVLALDCRAFGGQAGASSRIETYLGFPTGITGMALMARAYNQALKFGVEMAIPDQVSALAATNVLDPGASHRPVEKALPATR